MKSDKLCGSERERERERERDGTISIKLIDVITCHSFFTLDCLNFSNRKYPKILYNSIFSKKYMYMYSKTDLFDTAAYRGQIKKYFFVRTSKSFKLIICSNNY